VEAFPPDAHEDKPMVRDRVYEQFLRLIEEANENLDRIADQARRVVADMQVKTPEKDV
jgi:hypothetical protein